jgi:hypothetical protein
VRAARTLHRYPYSMCGYRYLGQCRRGGLRGISCLTRTGHPRANGGMVQSEQNSPASAKHTTFRHRIRCLGKPSKSGPCIDDEPITGGGGSSVDRQLCLSRKSVYLCPSSLLVPSCISLSQRESVLAFAREALRRQPDSDKSGETLR